MKFKIFSSLFLIVQVCTAVAGQQEWVWGKSSNGANSNNNNNNNNRPQGGNSGNVQTSVVNHINNRPNSGSNLVPVNTVTIFGNGAGVVSGPSGSSSSGNPYFNTQTGSGSQPAVIVQVLQPAGSQARPSTSTIPASPSSTIFSDSGSSNSNNNNNDIIPSNSIRAVNGEPRLFTRHLRKLFQGAVNNLVGGNGGGGGGLLSSGGGGGGGTINQGILNSLLQIGPQLAQGIGSRFPTAAPLPISASEFNTEGSSSNGNSISSGGGGGGGGGGSSCNCVPDDQCRLPSIARGTCSGGVMCCRGSGTRVLSSGNTKTSSVRFQPADLRAGLFGEIVRGTSNVIDDALDLILAPFLTQEDQQRLATRLSGSGTRTRKT